MIKTLFSPLIAILLVLPSSSLGQESLQESLFEVLQKQGVPAPALKEVFDYLEKNKGQAVTINKKFSSSASDFVMRKVPLKVQSNYAAIIDFSLPSTEKRFLLMNLRTGQVEKFYTTHGRNTGQNTPLRFSNRPNSKQSSLGLYLTGEAYSGFYGRSLKLHGMDPSNSKAAERDVVLHPADYASEAFLKKFGRLGLSWGCTAIERSQAPKVVSSLGTGSVLYIYHADLMEQARLTPDFQEILNAQQVQEPVRDYPGEEQDRAGRR